MRDNGTSHLYLPFFQNGQPIYTQRAEARLRLLHTEYENLCGDIETSLNNYWHSLNMLNEINERIRQRTATKDDRQYKPWLERKIVAMQGILRRSIPVFERQAELLTEIDALKRTGIREQNQPIAPAIRADEPVSLSRTARIA